MSKRGFGLSQTPTRSYIQGEEVSIPGQSPEKSVPTMKESEERMRPYIQEALKTLERMGQMDLKEMIFGKEK